jgi:hypothetical protein
MVAALLLAVALAPAPSPRPDPKVAAYWREYCGLLRGCGLPAPEGVCTAALSSGVAGVTYDDERCREPRALIGRGVGPAGPLATRLYRFLGRRYRVVYPLEGTLALSVPRLSFLLDDLPLAARLLAHYQKVPYRAEYLEGNRIKAARGNGLEGEGEMIAGSTTERTLYYFGSGVSHLGPWKLRGLALLEVRYRPADAGLAYEARVVSAPANAFLNTIMNLGVFKSVLRGRVRQVLDDIAEASAKLQRDGGRSLSDDRFTAEDRRRIAAFLALP